MRRVVVVGASLAGLRTAQALRRFGHDGEILLVGDEAQLPYDRPPLSKHLLDGAVTPVGVDLPVAAELGLTWRLGTPATALDLLRREVHLAGGVRVPFDGLVIATGARARPWPGGSEPSPHVAGGAGPLAGQRIGGSPRRPLTLRTLDDAVALSDAMAGAHRLLVIGAGFLGGEIAAAARRRGLEVTLVEPALLPLAATGGAALGRFVAGLHRDAGVDLRLGCRVTDLTADTDGRSTGGRLDDGSAVVADLVVAALGAVPNTAWLSGSGLDLDGGVVCDAWCRPLLLDGTPAPGLVAAGDVTCFHHPLAQSRLSLGHWSNAVDQAETAARTLLGPDRAEPTPPVPSFWSDLHGVAIKAVGLPQYGDEYRVVEHDPPRRRLVVEARRAGRLVGAVTANRTSRLAAYNTMLQESVTSPARV